jgi:hypothetical protein
MRLEVVFHTIPDAVSVGAGRAGVAVECEHH